MSDSAIGDHYVHPVHPGWEFVAGIDESESYEVDISEIWRDTAGDLHLLTASGCSCWDGAFEEEAVPSLDQLETQLLTREGYTYNPSLEGARDLIARAKAVLA